MNILAAILGTALWIVFLADFGPCWIFWNITSKWDKAR